MFLFYLFILSSLALSQTDYAMILNAPYDPNYVRRDRGQVKEGEGYYKVFDQNVLKYYRTLGLAGINRDKIEIMNADGQNPFANTAVLNRKELISGVPAAHQTVDGKAKKGNLLKKFQELSKKMKAGDHLTLLITGHGERTAKGTMLKLWGENLSVDELRSYLKLLPPGASKHIVANFCFSGDFVKLTSEPNTCVFSSVDEKTLMKGYSEGDAYVIAQMDQLVSGVSFYDAQKHAELTDTRNGMGMNSLDYFLQKNEPKGEYVCDQVPDSQINSLLRSTAKANAQKPLEAYNLGFRNYKSMIEKALKEFAQLSPSEQNKRRGEFTRAIEVMKQNASKLQFGNRNTYLRNLSREQEFIEKASSQQLKKYLEIKACVNYAIKK